MSILLLKLVLTPALIGLASLAGRRWGHAVSGWIIALPLTSGPIVFILALSHGAAFASDAAAGILAGGLSIAAFIIAYARAALRLHWIPTLVTAILAFFAMTALLRPIHIPVLPLWLAVLAVFFLALRLLPSMPPSESPEVALPGYWDIPLRMLIATAFVFIITSLASSAGPHLAGLLAPFPIFTATMAAFAQHQHGVRAVFSVLRGLLLGLFAFASFMFTLTTLLIPLGIAAAFGVAILVVFTLQAGSLWLLRRRVE